ncbi:hypothetical protein JOQ06_005430 [Pogonophryne albipinna]|uniref:Uncharacterized protein n=1 Tax=Pogonophryne albipinna TaxID=1090488 RepID=A0AAD6BHJ1_9TELE|nr:hypothetical protein JOQ06_005430 [Pogonophryne albipinna]
MIELLNFQDKVKILRLAREKKSLDYNGKHISIYPDFSPELTRRRRSFDPVKRKLRELNMKYFLLYPCTLCVKDLNSSSSITGDIRTENKGEEKGIYTSSNCHTSGLECKRPQPSYSIILP